MKPATAAGAAGATVKLKPMPAAGTGQTTVVPPPEGGAAPAAPSGGNPPPLTPSATGAKSGLKLKKEEAPAKEASLPPGVPAAAPQAPSSAATQASPSSAATQVPPAARTSSPKPSPSATSGVVNIPAASGGGDNPGVMTVVGVILSAIASIAALVLNILAWTTYLQK